MKSWKTTLAGLVAGLPMLIDALITAYNAGTFTGKTGAQTLASVGIVVLGLIAKDHNVTGGTVAKIMLPFIMIIGLATVGSAQSIFKALPPYKSPIVNKSTHALVGPTDSLPALSTGSWNGFRFSGPDVVAAVPDFSLYTGVGIDYVLAKAAPTTGKWSYTFTAGPRIYGGANLGVPGSVQAVAGVGVRLTFLNGLLAVGMIYNLSTKKAQGTIGNPAAIIPGLN